MHARRGISIGLSLALGLVQPAWAQRLGLSDATPSYHPFFAAGLNYAPIAFAAGPGTLRSDPLYPGLKTYGFALAVNPLPGMGQVYAGETLRGFWILGGGAAMLGATAVANSLLNRQGRFTLFEPAPSVEALPALNLGYFVAASLYSLWAAYDAYQLAERKNAAAHERGRPTMPPEPPPAWEDLDR